MADRGYKGLATLAAKRQLKLDIKAKPPGTKGFTPIGPLWRVEHAFAQLGRWRRLARCYEGSEASAKAWLEVASSRRKVSGPFGKVVSAPTVRGQA